jgi:AcrR family transcriptional regulator
LGHQKPPAGTAIAVVKTASCAEPLSHNLLGQRLGRKGRDTRERILSATEKLLTGSLDAPISLSAVAREASLGMTTLYLYFSDLTELLLAVLAPVMASAELSYAGHLRNRWPPSALAENCLKFVEAYHEFWVRHSRILHLRNTFADNGDERMRKYRIGSSEPLLSSLVRQMEGDPADMRTPVSAMATVLMTGLERMVTVTTDPYIRSLMPEEPGSRLDILLAAEARLLELGIREGRARAKKSARPARKYI